MPEPLLPTPMDQADWGTGRWPLGAAYDQGSSTSTFAVAAPRATRVLLEIHRDATGADPVAEVDLARGDGGVWRGRLAHVEPSTPYGYRVWGPGWDVSPDWSRGNSAAGFVADVSDDGYRFNPNKLLTDPYAREITHSPRSPLVAAAGLDDGVFGTGGEDYRGRPRRDWDTGRVAPKAVVIDDATPTGIRPGIDPESTAVYEAHVRGLTAHPSASTLRATLADLPGFGAVTDVPPELRGTYAGAALLAAYVRALGFTTIELLPVQETTGSEPGLAHPNYWGYATLGFFAPNRQYAADQSPGGPTREFKAMVAAFHDAGVEVWLDVVYNHTGEGGQWGGRLDTVGFTTLGGFSTPDYYALTDAGALVDGATGVSNQLDASSPLAQRLVTDSLAYWADQMGVDGFRFDLAPVLGRSPDDHPRDDWEAQKDFREDAPLLVAIRSLAQERDIEVVAEPWDLWGYEVGNFPPGWTEWNGRYRDGVRRYLKGDGNTQWFIEMVNGDFRDFAHEGGPQRSVNFVTAHDGFTMTDLVSYDGKDNSQPAPFGPSDGGSDDNLSWGSGGDQALRRARQRAFWAVLFVSRGIPMIVAGDELGRTQNGNNNPYAVNSVGIWINWAMAGSRSPTAVLVDPADPSVGYRDVLGQASTPDGVNPFLGFAAYMAGLRRDHPALRQRTYGDLTEGGTDVSYLFAAPDGSSVVDGSRSVRVLIDASGVEGDDLLVLVNMDDRDVDFDVPPPDAGTGWRRLVDTAPWAEPEGNRWPAESADPVVGTYGVQRWSVVVLMAP